MIEKYFKYYKPGTVFQSIVDDVPPGLYITLNGFQTEVSDEYGSTIHVHYKKERVLATTVNFFCLADCQIYLLPLLQKENFLVWFQQVKNKQ